MSINEHRDIIPDPVRLPLVLNRRARALQRKMQNSKANRTRTVPDKRRFQRVNIPSFGRFMRENKQEYPCQIVDMSAGGIAVNAPITGEIGERIIIYVDNMGRLEGELVRTFEGGFALKLSASSYKREKIVNQLTWLINKDELNIIEDRRHHRFSPAKTSTRMTMADGTVHDCTILDMSLGGAAVSVMPRPEIGHAVTLGLTPGKVVRLTDTAVNIQFLEIQDPATLERQFG
jgi:PilZ domain-containing protein